MSEGREGQCGEYHKVLAQMRRPFLVHLPSTTENQMKFQGKLLREAQVSSVESLRGAFRKSELPFKPGFCIREIALRSNQRSQLQFNDL